MVMALPFSYATFTVRVISVVLSSFMVCRLVSL